MKKVIILFFGPVLVIVLGLSVLLFLRPLLLMNPKNLAWLLHRTKVFKEWSWSSARFSHERKGWFHRNFEGEFRDLCFKLERPSLKLDACFDVISWNLDLLYDGDLALHSLAPLKVVSPFLHLTPVSNERPKTSSALPDVYGYWKKFWASYVPDLRLTFKKITIETDKKPFSFDLAVLKAGRELTADALGFKLFATPQGFTVRAPPRYPFPKDLGTQKPIYLRDFVLKGKVSQQGIPLDLRGRIEAIDLTLRSFIDLPLRGDFSSLTFQRKVLLKTSGELKLLNVRKSVQELAPPPYNRPPAPLNVMEGDLHFLLAMAPADKDSVLAKGELALDFKGQGQVIDMTVSGNVPVNLRSKERGAMEVAIDFRKLALKLPRLSKKVLPPQFTPDGRFKKSSEIGKEKEPKKGPPVNAHLLAIGEKALHLKSNLLDEPLRLNFDLLIKDSDVKDGYLKVLPLKTTVFKRPIHLQETVLTFSAPLAPVIRSTVVFPLPEYKVTMEIEGPVGKPRYAFSSIPPLPERDIYAVLLFGRPMDQLSSEDKTNASRTNQVLSQGLLSLSTLYFLAGSPVEYIGYDPGSKTATAQIGIGRKSSLRLGGGQEGLNSTAVRRSLGKGWYLDTSVQDTKTGTQGSKNQSFGVMLERLISY